MDAPILDGLAGFADIGLRAGVDMRPTLLRVLTDLYVQKLSHSPDEERHYCELALRLLAGVDPQTRAAVAKRLARHLSPPLGVVQYLVNDLPEIAAPLRSHPLLKTADAAGAEALQSSRDKTITHASGATEAVAGSAPHGAIDGKTASELNELFFAADSQERALILRNLGVVAPLPAGWSGVAYDPAIGHRLETAALSHNREAFAQCLAQALQIPRDQARRMTRDSLGEPIVVAAKALNISRELLYRILMFVNTSIGHSVERVHALATLYDEITMDAAQGMVSIWQSLKADGALAWQHRPLSWDDQAGAAARPAAVRRAPAASQPRQRRDAS
jgi:hypothetical protein